MKKPDYYTVKEAGQWREWPKDAKWDESALSLRDKQHIRINGLQVHALAWGVLKDGDIDRWDCISGFTSKKEDYAWLYEMGFSKAYGTVYEKKDDKGCVLYDIESGAISLGGDLWIASDSGYCIETLSVEDAKKKMILIEEISK